MTRRVLIVCEVVALLGAWGCKPGQSAPTVSPSPPSTPDFRVTSISADFRPDLFNTAYSATVRGLGVDFSTVIARWSGPSCGTWGRQTPQEFVIGGGLEVLMSMVWEHPHPPCGDDPNHLDTLVILTVVHSGTGKTIICLYPGAASGEGPACGSS